MCDVMEKAENTGIAKGITMGITKGEAKQLLNIVDNMMSRLSLSLSEVLDMIGVTVADYDKAKQDFQ